MPAHNLIVGLGGRDVTYEQIADMVKKAWKEDVPEVIWGDTQVSSGHEVTREILCEFSELFDGQPTGLVEGLDTDG